MTKVIVDPSTSAKLVDLQGPLELCDESGQILEQFIPAIDPSRQGALDPGISDEELDRREREEGGRPLVAILADLERRV